MENHLRKRIRARLEALGISSYEAARRADLNRYAVYDLLIEKKETMRPKALIALAKALECDPEYLNGTQAELRRAA